VNSSRRKTARAENPMTRLLTWLGTSPIDRRQRRAMTRMYAQFISRGDLCFDIGANIGNRVTIFRALGAQVVALEPQRDCVDSLREKFGHDRNVTILPVGLAGAEGSRRLRIADAHTISSMSDEWITAVQESGRFSAYEWPDSIEVPVLTLDRVIAQAGMPSFCKIDVEGYELEVLRGLSRPVPAISFEVTCEYPVAGDCIHYLTMLAAYEFNYSAGESMEFASPHWMSGTEVKELLELRKEPLPWGDVYARLRSGTWPAQGRGAPIR
jgi:FkbM family methyltransferase